MIFTGNQRMLMSIWSTFDNVLDKQYAEEEKRGEIKVFFDMTKELSIETTNPKFEKEMMDEFKGWKGKLKRMQLRAAGVKVELLV